MKKGSHILLLACAMGFCILAGIFIGRNSFHSEFLMPTGGPEVISPTEELKDFRLDINTAGKVQLDDLPGIGEALAQRILDYRAANGPFQSIEDLLNVEGIGQKTLEEMEILIKVGG